MLIFAIYNQDIAIKFASINKKELIIMKKRVTGLMTSCITTGLLLLLFSTPAYAYRIGDINNDNGINAIDASRVLNEYASLSSGGKGSFTAEQTKAADVNSDGELNAVDASLILSYYAYTASGGDETVEEYLKPYLSNHTEPVKYDTRTFIGAHYSMEIPSEWKVSFPVKHEYIGYSDNTITEYDIYNDNDVLVMSIQDAYLGASLNGIANLSRYTGLLRKNTDLTSAESRKAGNIPYLYSAAKDKSSVFYDAAYNGIMISFSIWEPSLVPDDKAVIERILGTVESDTDRIQLSGSSFGSLSEYEKKGVIGSIMFMNKYFTYSDSARIRNCAFCNNGRERLFVYELEYNDHYNDPSVQTFIYSLDSNTGMSTGAYSDVINTARKNNVKELEELDAEKMNTVLQEYYSR